MNALIPQAWAQAGGGAGPAGPQFTFVMMLVLLGVMYFILIRPQQKKAKEHQAMVSRLAVGDEVVTSGGILGKVTDLGDTFVTLEIADGVRIKVQKIQVTSLMPKGTLKSA